MTNAAEPLTFSDRSLTCNQSTRPSPAGYRMSVSNLMMGGGDPMGVQTRDWREMNKWIADLLMKRTGVGVETWNARIQAGKFADEAALRSWLAEQGVTGYPQGLLIMERFGYPDFFLASADQLIDNQYADRLELRPILDAILTRVATFGEVTIQTRKTYLSLVTPRRTFAAVQPSTKRRVDLGLRLENEPLGGRIESAKSMGSGQVTVRIGLTSIEQVDDEVEKWLRRAYEENA